MAKENKKRVVFPVCWAGGRKKTLMVWGCILSTANVFFQLVPFLAVYNIMAELLKNASDLTNADTGFMVSWAVKGIVGLLIGYVFMYFGGMLGHTAAYRTLYGIRVRLSEHISELPLGWFNRNAIGKVKQIAEQDVEQIEKFIAHQFPDMVNTIAMLIVMVIIMFRLNVAGACLHHSYYRRLYSPILYDVWFQSPGGLKGILRRAGKYQHIVRTVCTRDALN